MTKQTVYGCTPEELAKQQKKGLYSALVLAAGTVLLNILLALLRNDSNHIWLLIANIATDIACGIYLVYYFAVQYAPRQRLLKLNNRMKEVISGEITEVEPYTTRFANLDCVCVYLGRRRTFLPVGTLQLEVGSQVELTLSGNVILEVAQ